MSQMLRPIQVSKGCIQRARAICRRGAVATAPCGDLIEGVLIALSQSPLIRVPAPGNTTAVAVGDEGCAQSGVGENLILVCGGLAFSLPAAF